MLSASQITDCVFDLTGSLFKHEYARLDKARDEIVKGNDRLRRERGMKDMHGFVYDGIIYRLSVPPVFHKAVPALQPEMEDGMRDYLADRKKVDLDRQRIGQTVLSLIGGCESTQDIRDALPECVIFFAPMGIDKMQRTPGTEAASHLEGRALRQYEKNLELMQFYSTTRLFY